MELKTGEIPVENSQLLKITLREHIPNQIHEKSAQFHGLTYTSNN
jgi:hypothetical protein